MHARAQTRTHTHACTYILMFCLYRYGREDLEVFGLNFRRDLVDVGVAVCCGVVISCCSLGENAGVSADIRIEAAANDPSADQTDEEAR